MKRIKVKFSDIKVNFLTKELKEKVDKAIEQFKVPANGFLAYFGLNDKITETELDKAFAELKNNPSDENLAKISEILQKENLRFDEKLLAELQLITKFEKVSKDYMEIAEQLEKHFNSDNVNNVKDEIQNTKRKYNVLRQ